MYSFCVLSTFLCVHPRLLALMIGAVPDYANFSFSNPISVIDSDNPVELGKFSILDDDSVISIEFSGGLLAGISIGGQVKIWQVSPRPDRPNWPLLRVLRDAEEEEIDEFLTGAFLPNGRFVVAGKRKLRHFWDEAAEDSKTLPGILKIFDLKTGQCIQRLGVHNITNTTEYVQEGHVDEILFLKPIRTRKSGNFIVSCGQDGRLCRWSFSDDWATFKGVRFVKLGKLAFHFEQISEELVAVAVDNGLIIYDILNMRVNDLFRDRI